MNSKSDLGHFSNAKSLKQFIAEIVIIKQYYNPIKDIIKLESFQAKSVEIDDAFTNLFSAITEYKKALDKRKKLFSPLNKILTRVKNFMMATDIDKEVIETIVLYIRKIQGIRVSAKLDEEQLKTLAAEGKEVKQISASQTSFNYRLMNLEQLINILSSLTEYTPYEEKMQVASLNSMYEELKNANQNVIDTESILSRERINRNKLLYDPETGLLTLVTIAKKYIVSVLGPSAPEVKRINKIAFRYYTI